MKRKTLHIKNMVCNRCIKVVKDEIEKLNYSIEKIELGEVVITSDKEKFNLEEIKKVLEENGFDLIDSRNANIIERIKILIINLIHHPSAESFSDTDLSKEIVNETDLSYQYVSSLFSSSAFSILSMSIFSLSLIITTSPSSIFSTP